MSEPEARATRRGRRPSDEVRAEIIATTMTLIAAGGLPRVTFDRVAAASGASKTTLYKWWPSPGALAAEAYFVTNESALTFPDTGDLLTDVRAQLRSFVHLVTRTPNGRIIAQLIGHAQSDPDLAIALSRNYTAPRRRLAIDYFVLAQQRGQLSEDADLQILVDQLWGACYNRLLVPDAPLDEGVADRLVANVLYGAATATYREERG